MDLSCRDSAESCLVCGSCILGGSCDLGGSDSPLIFLCDSKNIFTNKESGAIMRGGCAIELNDPLVTTNSGGSSGGLTFSGGFTGSGELPDGGADIAKDIRFAGLSTCRESCAVAVVG